MSSNCSTQSATGETHVIDVTAPLTIAIEYTVSALDSQILRNCTEINAYIACNVTCACVCNANYRWNSTGDRCDAVPESKADSCTDFTCRLSTKQLIVSNVIKS